MPLHGLVWLKAAGGLSGFGGDHAFLNPVNSPPSLPLQYRYLDVV